MPTITGLDALDKDMQEARARSATSQQTLRLKDGDVALMRFITNGTDIQTGFFHRVRTGTTKQGQPRMSDMYCGGDDSGCEWCADLEASSRRRLMHSYVFVYRITKGDGTVEHVNEPKLLVTGPGHGGYIKDFFLTYMRKNGTLLDRDFEWSRKGTKMEDTTYLLTPEDKTPMSAAVKEAAAKLPPLEEVVTGKTAMSGGTPQQPSRGPVQRSSLLERLKREDTAGDDEMGEEL